MSRPRHPPTPPTRGRAVSWPAASGASLIHPPFVSRALFITSRCSWGTGWGENGYIRVARYGSTPAGEPCLTDNTPGDGDGCKGGPASIQVCGLCGILSDSSYPVGAGLPQ